jgi:succinate dehydrogenase hydrophobic anchor subunit
MKDMETVLWTIMGVSGVVLVFWIAFMLCALQTHYPNRVKK